MKQLEEMSREELIEEIISKSKRLEDIEVANKEKKLKIAKLEKQVELLEKAQAPLAMLKLKWAKRYPICRNCLI